MRTILLSAAAALALGAAAPPASAAGGYEFQGDCDITGLGSGGDLFVYGVAYSSDPEKNPVTVAVTCVLRRDGVVLAQQTFTGTGVVAGSTPYRGLNYPYNHVEVCTTVDFVGSPGTPNTRCARYYDTQDSLEERIDDALIEHVDPVLCPALADLAPGAGPVAIDPDGDLSVAGTDIWYCPPYES